MLTYYDAYLSPYVTQSYEDRAEVDVDAIGTFATAWRNKLIVLRAYILICLESMAAEDDLFSAKLAEYRKEYNTTLGKAQSVTLDDDGNPGASLSISWERG